MRSIGQPRSARYDHDEHTLQPTPKVVGCGLLEDSRAESGRHHIRAAAEGQESEGSPQQQTRATASSVTDHAEAGNRHTPHQDRDDDRGPLPPDPWQPAREHTAGNSAGRHAHSSSDAAASPHDAMINRIRRSIASAQAPPSGPNTISGTSAKTPDRPTYAELWVSA
jgi:hypothetical protein